MNKSLILTLMGVVAVTACSSDSKKPQHLCPQTAIIRDLELARDYGNDTIDDKTLVATAMMKNVKGRCDYTDEGVEVEFDLLILGGKGPRLGGDRASFPFFISVLDPEKTIMSKEMMTAEIAFGGAGVVEKTEQLRVFIPLEKDADGSLYQVLMGFQLTEDQLREFRKAREKTAP